MGSITPHETSDGRRYRVRYRDPDRKSREKNRFTRKKDAEDFLANVTVSSTVANTSIHRQPSPRFSSLGPNGLRTRLISSRRR